MGQYVVIKQKVFTFVFAVFVHILRNFNYTLSFKKAEICLHTTFRWNISVYGWDKITSGFERRTAAIFDFCFRFWFDLCVTMCMWFCFTLPNFVLIRRSPAELWRHIDSQDGGHGIRNLLPGTGLVTAPVHVSRSCVSSFSEISLSKTKIKLLPVSEMDGCHIGIVLPVSILTYLQSYANHQKHQPVKFRRNMTIGCEVMASYRFFKMAVIEWEIYFRVWFWCRSEAIL